MEMFLGQDNRGAETIDEEIIKELMSLRSYLEKRIAEVEEESEKLGALFKIIDEEIVMKSFKKAESISVTAPNQSPPTPPPTSPTTYEVPLKSSDGVLLATMYVGEDNAKIVPIQELTFDTNMSPFQSFFVARILEPIRAKDVEDSQSGLMSPDQVFSYKIVTEGEIIKEIILNNFGTRNRLRDIISSSRWTFEKMYDKIQNSSDTM